jgi:hypothetical protein
MIEGGADRMRAHRAIRTGLHTRLAADDDSLHERLLQPPGDSKGAAAPQMNDLNRLSAIDLRQIKR